MVENVSYKRCTCDVCRKEQNIPTTSILPEGWKHIKIHEECDICEECYSKMIRLIPR